MANKRKHGSRKSQPTKRQRPAADPVGCCEINYPQSGADPQYKMLRKSVCRGNNPDGDGSVGRWLGGPCPK